LAWRPGSIAGHCGQRQAGHHPAIGDQTLSNLSPPSTTNEGNTIPDLVKRRPRWAGHRASQRRRAANPGLRKTGVRSPSHGEPQSVVPENPRPPSRVGLTRTIADCQSLQTLVFTRLKQTCFPYPIRTDRCAASMLRDVEGPSSGDCDQIGSPA
jgi:hypothetical protein